MLRKFNPIIEEIPVIFREDVYLFTDSGEVLTGRHGDEPIKNILDLIEPSEFPFVRDNMFYAGLHPLLLVKSSRGPIFIDVSLFGSYRLFIAILPHLTEEEIFALLNCELKSIAKPSPSLKSNVAAAGEIELGEVHLEFAERLLATHRGAYYYRRHGKTNAELAVMMSEIAYDYSKFCGCELEFEISGVGLYEMKNDLCVDSYIFALTSLLLLARNYSKSRRAKMDVFFNEMGLYFEFGFEICDEFQKTPLLWQAKELKNFKFWSSSRLFDCDFYQSERIFALRAYPWFKHPDSADIKAPKKEFIYNL